MKWAISNLAWEPSEDEGIAEDMREFGVSGLEVVPLRVASEPLRLSIAEIQSWKDFWQQRGIELVAMQSLLYGQPQLKLFERDASREETIRYLAKLFALARQLGIPSLVFGSPQNRRRGSLSLEEAWEVAVPFFRTLGELAKGMDVCLCIEANPPQYGCDFITTSEEALRLVQDVDSPGFGLHLDSAVMSLAGENLPQQAKRLAPWIRHLHLSAPDLAPVQPCGIDYPALLESLKAAKYPHWISVEMKSSPQENRSTVRSVLSFMRELDKGASR